MCYIVTYADSHLHTCTYICSIIHSDTTIKKQEWRRKKTSLEKYSPLSLFVRFAFESMLETEHKLHILTPLLWPSRCVFIVLLMLGSTPSGLSEGPLGRVWPSLPHLVSNPLGVCWQLLWDPNSTELNNNSTPTRSPTGSLNRMFNRHQAEITVMQFRGYSLPVHHC